jgi:hypothetical protein
MAEPAQDPLAKSPEAASKASVHTSLYQFMRRNRIDDSIPMRAARFVYDRWAVRTWRKKGQPAPPPYAIKRQMLREYARRFGVRLLVETGTFYGDTTFALRNDFDRIVSIELDRVLHQTARYRLRAYKQITLLQGDSSNLIAHVLESATQPVLFWLDAHYSGGITARGQVDSPIYAELDAIIAHPVRNHVILIDDARCFVGRGGYPTIPELREYLRERRPDWSMDLRHDVIRIQPAETALGVVVPHQIENG